MASTTTTMFLIIFSLISLSSIPTPTTAANPNITAVFAFGDSILDPGNNNVLPTLFKSNHPPYGHDFPGGVPTGRFSDGMLFTDFLVSKLGLKNLLPAYFDSTLTNQGLLTGASFASAGSGLDFLTTQEAFVQGLPRQLISFGKALGRIRSSVGLTEADRIAQNALFFVASGTNDMVFNYYGFPLRRPMGLSSYQDQLLQSLDTSITLLHGMGARIIAVTGLPPIGCLPLQVTIGSFMPSPHMFQRVCVRQQNQDSQAYNAKLQSLTARLQQELPGSKIVYVDIYNPMMDMIQNPAKYGFTNIRNGCCGIGAIEMGPLCNAGTPICRNPSNHMFWDAVHPTQATYKSLAIHFYNNVLPTIVN